MPFLFAGLLLLGVAALGYANGSNDISKGIATLVGSGVTRYRQAILWGTVWTIAGSIAAAFFSRSLVKTFSAGFISPQFEISRAFVLAVLVGAIGWVAFSTKTGLPVSTTHAITGALCGVGIVAFGIHGIAWTAVTSKVFIPLLFSPVVSLALLWALYPAMQFVLSPLSRRCACAEIRRRQILVQASLGSEVAVDAVLPALHLVVDHLESCEAKSGLLGGFALDDGLHWVSSGLTSFARGLNDAPKIVALGLGLTLLLHQPSVLLFVLVAAAIGLGSFVAGLRVTETLAEKVTPMNATEGLSANLITSLLVTLASRWGLPVSTTHVSSGSILGVGIHRGEGSVRWRTVWAMLEAWIVTLPVAGVLAILAWWMMREIFKIS